MECTENGALSENQTQLHEELPDNCRFGMSCITNYPDGAVRPLSALWKDK